MRFWVRLTLLFVVLGLGPLLVLGYFSYRSSQQVLLDEARSHASSISVLKEDALLEWMEGNTALLESITLQPHVVELTGRLIESPRGTAVWTATHEDLLADHLKPNLIGGIEDLAIMHPESGQILVATDRRFEGRFRESERYFLGGRESLFIDRVAYQVSVESLALHISGPIRTVEGTLVGVLSAQIDLEEMGRIVRLTSGSHETQDIYLINDSALFVTEPLFGQGYALRRMLHTEGAAAALRGETGVAEYVDYRDVRVVGAYRWIDKLAMGLLVETDWSEVTAPVQALGRTIIVGEILVGAAVLLIAVLFARGVVRPIRRLKAGTEAIGRGDLTHRIRVRGRHEIADLGRSFNRMTENLQEVTASRDELDREVKARSAAEERLKKTVAALEQSESQFRQLSEASPVGVFMFQDMTLKYVNPAIERIFGYAAVELIGKLGPMDLTDRTQHEETAEYIGKCFAQVPDLPPMAFRGVRKDGSLVYCEAMGRPVDYEGRPALLGTIVDVTSRREAEAALRESERSLNRAQEIAHIGSWEWHVVEDVVNWSEEIYRIFDCAKEELPNSFEGFAQFIHPEDREAVQGAIDRALRGEAEYRIDHRILLKDGTVKVLHAQADFEFDVDGRPVRIVGTAQDITARVEADARLREQWENTKTILDGIPHVIYVADPQTHEVLFVNDHFRKLLGRDPVGKICYKAFQGFEEPCDFCTNDRILETGEPYDWEYFNPMLERQFLISDRIIRWSDRAQARLELAMDITELLQLQKENRKLSGYFRSLLESDQVAIAIQDGRGDIIEWNRGSEILTGFSREDVVGRAEAWLAHRSEVLPEEAKAANERFRALEADPDRSIAFEATLAHKDGSLRTAICNSGALVDTSGGFMGTITIYRDITARMEAEQELARAKAVTDSIIEGIPGIFYQIDSDVRLVRWNRNLEEVSGYGEDEVAEMSPLDFFDEENGQLIADAIGRVFSEGYADVSARLKTSSGDLIPYFFTGITMVIDEVPYLIGMGTDISELKAIEAQLRQSMAELERSNKELEQFAYVASHDLQEPLRMVASYTQLLEKRYKNALDEDARDFIGYAVGGANRMQRLINDLLAYSRVQTRGKPFERVDLSSVLGQARGNLAAAVDEAAAVVTNGELPSLMADEGQLVSVFQNLIGNAIKFRGDEPPRVHVSAADAGLVWEISVRDNGIGINPEFHDRIFVIFQRLHGRDEYEGTGIGLALCKRIVERHGGRIWVESTPGEGTTFHFTLSKRPKEAE